MKKTYSHKPKKCEYHLCEEKTDKLEQCAFCGGFFCKKHHSPKIPLLVGDISKEKDLDVKMFLEKEWNREDAHPCMPYGDKLKELRERGEESYKEFLDKIQKHPIKKSEFLYNVYTPLPPHPHPKPTPNPPATHKIPVKTISIIVILFLIGFYIYHNPHVFDFIFKNLSVPNETFTPTYEQQTKIQSEPYINITEFELQVFNLVNTEREKNGLKPLIWDSTVAKFARNHSEDMAKNNYFSHEDLSGLTACDRMPLAPAYVIYWICGENIFEGNIEKSRTTTEYGVTISIDYKTQDYFANEAVQGWMNSEGHRKNILEKGFNRGALGIAKSSDGTYYFTQDFIGRT